MASQEEEEGEEVTSYTNEFFGIPNDDTRFNLSAAIDAYEWVMEHPDESRFVISKMLYDYVPEDMRRNSDKVEAAANAFIAKRLNDAKRGVARSYIAKRDSGQDTESSEMLVHAIEEISKAYGNTGNYNQWERAANAKKQRRDEQGRFVVMSHKIKPDVLKRPISPMNAKNQLGVPNSNFTPEQRRQFQNDYLQVKDMLNSVVDADRVNAVVVGRYSSGSEFEMPFDEAKDAIDDNTSASNGLVTAVDYKNGERLKEFDVVSNEVRGGPEFNALAGMTNPAFASMVEGGVSSIPGFTGEWTRQGKDDYRTDDQFWRRMGAASSLAATVGAPVLPPAATMALQAGKYIGDLAPEAEKVIGPAARRAAYRYRGVEKKPDPKYQEAINSTREKFRQSNHPMPGRAAHDLLIRGVDNPKTKEHIDSPLIALLKNRLTDPQRYHLNRMSGTVPPSQGIIVDRKGRVITEAVGYGEDWYLPFNLKNLSKLDGGEYFRTRAYGGPTTEDIYVGLVSGARAVTVVSHSGVFTIEFDDTFRGARRFNDKAGRMQERYGQLLDAVKSRKVRLGQISPERMEEIKEEAADIDSGGFNPVRNKRDYEERVRELVAEERESPRLSQSQENNEIRSLLNEYAAEHGAATWDDYVTQQIVAGKKASPKILSDNLREAADAVGLGKQADKAIADAQAVYREELEPLDINGKGYYQAMLALTDQFPYYFNAPYFSGAGPKSKDLGYVKPRYIRPEGALAGYFDPTITGKGKITADRTHYQNYSVEQTRTPSDSDFITADSDEDDLTPTGGAIRRGSAGRNSEQAKVDLLIDQIKALRAQRVFGPNAVDGNGDPLGGRPFDDEAKQGLAEAWGWEWLTKDTRELERELYLSGPNGQAYKDIKNQVDDAFDGPEQYFDITREKVRSEAERDILNKPPRDPMALIIDFPDIASGAKKYNWPDLKEGQTREYYNSKIQGWMRYAPAFAGADADPDNLAAIMDQRGDDMRRELRAGGDERQISVEAESMAKIVQAARWMADAPGGIRGSEEAPFVEASEAEAPEQEAPEPEDSATVAREKRIAQSQEEIRQMVGMSSVANEIDGLVDTARLNQWKEENGIPVDKNASKHLVFTGNPGTGKTTIAKKLGQIYYDLGITKDPTIFEVTPGQLAGEYTNQAETHALDLLDENKGKVIFIDEAHAMLEHADGPVVYNALLKWAENNRDDSVIILAGYPGPMAKMLKADPGMKSRFPNPVHFPNYSSKDLREITSKWIKDSMMSIEEPAQVSLNIALGKLVNESDYANVRSARNLMNKISTAHAKRVATIPEPTREDRLTYTREDIKNGVLLSKEKQMEEQAKKAKAKVAV